MKTMESGQQLTVILWWLTAGFSLALFVMALTNRVVVFINGMDVFTTLSIGLAPMVMSMVLGSLDMQSPLNGKFPSEPVGIIVVILGFGATIFAIVKTFMNSIHCNGLVLGIIVSIFKIFSLVLLILAVIGTFLGAKSYEGGVRQNAGFYIVLVLIFGIFGWVARTLINGERVFEHRQLMAEEAD